MCNEKNKRQITIKVATFCNFLKEIDVKGQTRTDKTNKAKQSH